MCRKLRLAAPPLIIFLDFLSQFLFVSMVQQRPHIEINVPTDKLFYGGKIVYQMPSGGVKYYDGVKFKNLDKNFGGSFYVLRSCVGEVCNEAKKLLPANIEPQIAITGDVFANLSQLTFLACAISTSQCNNVRYDILADGSIDKDALLQHNPLFKDVNGLEAF
jgi:hypothetical protein